MVMEIETAPLSPQQREYNDGSSDQRSGAGADAAKPLYRNPIVVVNFLLMALGTVCGPLLFRAYFLHGGTSKWLTCLLQTAGWPLLLPPLCVSFFSRRRRRQRDESATETEAASISLMSAGLLAATVAIGLIDFLYAYGLAYLPVSTSSILVSTQLAFTAVFALLVVRQRFTAFSVNAVVLLVVGAAMLGLNGGGDRPAGVSRAQYYAGFAMTLGSAALYGLVLPLMELSQARHAARAGPAVTYTLVLEIQMVIGITATAFSGVGMLVNKDFHEIPDEARRFDLGEAGYYFMLVSSATAFQCFFIGTIGAIFYGSALLAGVIMTLLISIIEVFAVLLFHEPFNGTKGVALAISVWGFISYFYGEIRTKEQQSNTSTDKEHLDPYINLYCGVVCTFQ